VNLSPDPKDNPILAAAIAGKADLIVSGDKKHMLALGAVAGIPIVTAKNALDRLGNARNQPS
jgi:predicted nucleic acid-binding protein